MQNGYRRAGQVVATFRQGQRTTRAWNQNGVRGSAELLIKLAWETTLAKDQCAFASFGLLLRRSRIVDWNPTVFLSEKKDT